MKQRREETSGCDWISFCFFLVNKREEGTEVNRLAKVVVLFMFFSQLVCTKSSWCLVRADKKPSRHYTYAQCLRLSSCSALSKDQTRSVGKREGKKKKKEKRLKKSSSQTETGKDILKGEGRAFYFDHPIQYLLSPCFSKEASTKYEGITVRALIYKWTPSSIYLSLSFSVSHPLLPCFIQVALPYFVG